MKFNNRGWSFQEMLIIMVLLIGCLLLVTFYVYRLYSQIDNKEKDKFSKDRFYYEKFEHQLKKTAEYYVENIYLGEVSSSFIITMSDLNDVEILSKYKEDIDCNGYVKVAKYNGNYDYDPYLKCDNYKTKNYETIYE